jgi:biotin carboxyl carrier protein
VAAVEHRGRGMYLVERDGQQSIVYVAGEAGDLWAFADGQVFRERMEQDGSSKDGPPRPPKGGHYLVGAPMPATVVKVLVAPGQAVRGGDTLIIVEAMKMELPIRAPGDATVKAVNCREGELVQPDRTLVELE